MKDSGVRRRLLLVSPRPPRRDGHGDQRRAHEVMTALSPEWDVDVVSWLPDVESPGWRRWALRPAALLRMIRLAVTRPLQVAYVQARAPRRLAARLAESDAAVLITDRAVMGDLPAHSVVDFVDDLSGVALRRAKASRGLSSAFWRWESQRLRRFDCMIAERAAVAVAHSAADAAGIAGRVGVVPLSVATQPLPPGGDRVLFMGNLYYAPNHEAAMWLCAELAPELRRIGLDPGRLLLAGRRPRPALRALAARAGVELRADVDDLLAVLGEAAVVLSPMALGTGTQYKVLDACGADRACVLTPVANAGLGLVDGVSGLVRERRPEPFAEAIALLLDDADLRARIASDARRQIGPYLPESVAATWRATVADSYPKGGSEPIPRRGVISGSQP